MPEETVRGLKPGQQLFGRYVARQFVKRSERSELWIAEDRQGAQWVQLVVWPPAIKAERARFGRLKVNLTRAMQLKHPTAVQVFDLLDDGRYTVLVMEAPAGRSWEQMLRERRPRPFEPEELAGVIGPVCQVLDHAWTALSLAHGCVRPSQIIICPDGSPKLQGFGLAPSISQGGEAFSWQEGIEDTLIHLSPQQLRGEEPGPRDDVYGLGMSLYRMIVSRPPYLVHRIGDALRQPDPPPMSDQRLALGIEGGPIPPDWERVVLDCLARDAAKRPSSAGEVARRLLGSPAASASVGRAPVPAGPGELMPAPKPVPAGSLQEALAKRLGSPRMAETIAPGTSPFMAPGVGGEAATKLVVPPMAAAGAPGAALAPRLFVPAGAADVPRSRMTPPPARDPLAEARQEGPKTRRRGHKAASRFTAALVAIAGLFGVAAFVVQMVGLERVRGLVGMASRIAAPAPKAPTGPTHLAAGQTFYNEAKFEAALSEFSLGLQQGEDKAEALYWRGRCCFALRKIDGAIAEFTAALEARPGHALSHLFRGYALAKGNRLGEALEDFNMAIASDPNLIDAYHHRGSVLLELGRYERAMDDLNKVVKAKPGFAVFYDRGLALFHMGSFPESLSDFDQAILQEPGFAPAYYNRGSVHYQTGRFREAVRDFSEAIRLNPRYENAYYMRGMASHRLSDHVRAVEDLSEAIRLRLDFREAWEQRGFARLAAGDYQKANEDFEQARKLASTANRPAGQAAPSGSAGGQAPAPLPAAPPSAGFNGANQPLIPDPKATGSPSPSPVRGP